MPNSIAFILALIGTMLVVVTANELRRALRKSKRGTHEQ
jgi:hypothetical protein